MTLTRAVGANERIVARLRGKASVARTVESTFMPQSSMLFTELSRTG